MAVQVNFRIDQLPWAGYEEPGLPTGAWIAQGTVTGQSVVGSMVIGILIQIASDPLSSRLYNIEQLMLSKTESLQETVNGRVNNMGHLVQDRPLARRQFSIPMLTAGNSFTSSDPTLIRPIFLGAPSGANLECGVDFRIDDNPGVIFDVTVQGYIWEPRSLLAPGGLRRPVGSIYGS